MVVFIGADVHKHSHTFVAVDEAGKRIGTLTVGANQAGHEKAYRWARTQFIDPQRRWGVEDCRQYTGLLERNLLAHGEAVVRVPTKMMAKQRAAARTRGKSDPIDALAVARAMAREEDLPAAVTDEPVREIKLFLNRREDLVAERTRVINRVRVHLHELDPDFDPAPGALSRRPAQQCSREVIHAALEAGTAGPAAGFVAELAEMLLEDLERLCAQIAALDERLRARVRELEPCLLTIPGCAEISAAKILAETAGIERFSTEAKYAMFAGCAPIPAWSGKTEGRMRLNRTGNRQLNCAIHRIALTQIRFDGPGKDYYQRRQANGKNKMEALRCLKTHIAHRLWRTLTRAHTHHPDTEPLTTEHKNPDAELLHAA